MKILAIDRSTDTQSVACIAGGEMGKILGKLGKRSLGGENENPVEDGFNEVGMGLE